MTAAECDHPLYPHAFETFTLPHTPVGGSPVECRRSAKFGGRAGEI